MAKSRGKKNSSRSRARGGKRPRRTKAARRSTRRRARPRSARRTSARNPRRAARNRAVEAELVLTPDDLEAVRDTQDLEPERTRTGIVGPSAVDVQRGRELAGGDVDAASDEQDVGEESVGGSTPTPDQDVVDDLGRAAGVTYADEEPLRPEEKIARRDEQRWEEDPASSEDYAERQRALRSPESTRPGSGRPSPGRPAPRSRSPRH